MMEIVAYIAFIIVVGYLAIEDLMHRRIPLIPIIIYWMLGLLFRVVAIVCADTSWKACQGTNLIRELLLYLLVAGGVVGMWWPLRHAIGGGDIYVVLATCLWFGRKRVFVALLFSMGMLSLWYIVSVLVCLVRRRRLNKDYELPYIPILWISVILAGVMI